MRPLCLCVIALVAVGCGDDDGPVCDLAMDGNCPAGCPTDPDCAAGDGGMEDGSDSGPPDNGVTGDEIYSDSCVAPTDCQASELDTACACVRRPQPGPEGMPNAFNINRVGCDQLEATGETVRTPEDDFCDDAGGDGAPELTCNTMGNYRVRGEVQMVTVYGVVDVFGNGSDADMITVEIYEEGTDGALGTMLGSAVASIDDPCSETEDEIENDMVVGTRRLGFYAIPNRRQPRFLARDLLVQRASRRLRARDRGAARGGMRDAAHQLPVRWCSALRVPRSHPLELRLDLDPAHRRARRRNPFLQRSRGR